MGDDLFALKNAFYLGNYQQAISEALTAAPSPTIATERDFYKFRAYIEQGQYRMVLDEIGADAPLSLQTVKLLATYMSSPRDTKDMVLQQLKEWLSQPTAMNNNHLLLIAGTIFCSEQDYTQALKYTHQNTDLELMSLVVHIYLAMNRTDLAKKQCARMAEQDEDATLSKLAAAWTTLSDGNRDKLQDALYEFQELGEKYTMSLLLLNGMAVCNLHLGRLEEAERLLQEALQKSATDVNTLINTAVCMHHLHKPPEVVARYTNQLKSVAPNHPWLTRSSELEASFERCSAQFSIA